MTKDLEVSFIHIGRMSGSNIVVIEDKEGFFWTEQGVQFSGLFQAAMSLITNDLKYTEHTGEESLKAKFGQSVKFKYWDVKYINDRFALTPAVR